MSWDELVIPKTIRTVEATLVVVVYIYVDVGAPGYKSLNPTPEAEPAVARRSARAMELPASRSTYRQENVQRMRSERPRDALASQHHLDASKSIQVTLAKCEASDGRYDLSSIGHSPTKSVRWMTVFSVSIGHFELQFLIGAGGRWSKKASKVRSMVEKTL
ncbi:hypothetical protein PGT21_006032 [Puccinia graminis f. sp. tritici]|uniref:Uncharacterized protein n=1 Tax=Puccinia graminis f. sp. tritici TaxID=56615 RepID=A0A5B0LKB1_PUCGR|nr:hypothetical protein PGT21_006032 [Puccinia graminis f. sp. tritici]